MQGHSPSAQDEKRRSEDGDNMRPLNMHVLILAAPVDNWVFGCSWSSANVERTNWGNGGFPWLWARLKDIHIIREEPLPKHKHSAVFKLYNPPPLPSKCLAHSPNKPRSDGQSDATCATSAHADRNKWHNVECQAGVSTERRNQIKHLAWGR